MKRKIELSLFLLMSLFLFVLVLPAPTEAEDKPITPDHGVKVTEIVAQPFEAPQESEKIEAALNWHYISGCTLTAYCACSECCGKDDGITATGTTAQEGVTLAVDPDVIPLGAWVEINGHQYHAEDVGGGVRGNHIDIYFDSHEAADMFGVRYEIVRWYLP